MLPQYRRLFCLVHSIVVYQRKYSLFSWQSQQYAVKAIHFSYCQGAALPGKGAEGPGER
jgi:hypothetical protein